VESERRKNAVARIIYHIGEPSALRAKYGKELKNCLSRLFGNDEYLEKCLDEEADNLGEICYVLVGMFITSSNFDGFILAFCCNPKKTAGCLPLQIAIDDDNSHRTLLLEKIRAWQEGLPSAMNEEKRGE